MKKFLFIALAALIVGCSKDDESKPANGGSSSGAKDLQIWVSSNHKYPILEIGKDLNLILSINQNSLTQAGSIYYSQQTVTPGSYKFYAKAWNEPSQLDTNRLDNKRLWVKCVIVLKGDTICNWTDSADAATPDWAILITNKVVN